MAQLQLPQTRKEAIIQDYRDKHSANGCSVLICRKYPQQVTNSNGDLVYDKAGNEVFCRKWYEAKRPTCNEDMYVYNSYTLSEKNQNDCYCTLNGFPLMFEAVRKTNADGSETSSLRAKELLQTLTGFYFDFDHKTIHTLAKTATIPVEIIAQVDSFKEHIIQTLENAFETDYGMPEIIMTGGGYGFFIKLKPLPATEENMALYLAVWELLYQKYNELLSDFLTVFENDHSVVSDPVRVIRIVGTYNSRTSTYAEFVRRYGYKDTNTLYEYSIDDIISLYHLDVDLIENVKKVALISLQKREKKEEKEKNKEIAKPSKKSILNNINNHSDRIPDFVPKGAILFPHKWYHTYVDKEQITNYLELSIKTLDYMNSINSLNRNCALFLIACFKTELEYSLYHYSKLDEVIDDVKISIINYIISLNDTLSNPLSEDELTILINSALQNKYHFREYITIQKYLNLSKYEFNHIGWLSNKNHKEEMKKNNQVLTDIDKLAIQRYLSGLSDAKIEKELGLYDGAVTRMRKRYGITDRTILFESIDFEGNKRHMRSNRGQNRPSSLCQKHLIPSERIEELFPRKYNDFFRSPIEDFSYYANHNFKYQHLRKADRQEIVNAFNINQKNYMALLGLHSFEEKRKQLLYLRYSVLEKRPINLRKNIDLLFENSENEIYFRSNKIETVTLNRLDGPVSVVVHITANDLYKPIWLNIQSNKVNCQNDSGEENNEN